jgi:hypothetical protein
LGKKIDITGQRFGFWVAIEPTIKNKNGQTQWLCICECGIKKPVTLNSLRTGNSTSCGCNHNPNLIGNRYNHLVVLKLIEDVKHLNRRYWQCQCDCGKTCIASTHQLTSKYIVSCGCGIETFINCNSKKDIENIYHNIRNALNSKELLLAIADNIVILKNNKKLMKIYNSYSDDINIVVKQLLLCE